MHGSEDEDNHLLEDIGYKPQLRREFTKWSIISYAISILGVLGSIPATFNVPLSTGGTGTVIWAWTIGSCMAFLMAMSVSELVSAYPTAGGMYFVTKMVVPEEQMPMWCWIVGWCNLVGQTAGVAGLAYSVGQMVLAGVSLNSASYSPSPGETVFASFIVLLLMGTLCSLRTVNLHRMVAWFAPINVLATTTICLTLLTLTPTLQPLPHILTTFTNGSNTTPLLSFLLGFLSVSFTMTDYDATTHISEETHHASLLGPLAITTAILVSGLLGLALNITLCLCIQDVDRVLTSHTGMAAAQILLDAVGRAPATLMWSAMVLVQVFTGVAAMLAAGRMAFAFARDRGLPFSQVWSRIHPRTLTPVNAVWLVVGSSGLLISVALKSTAASIAIFSLTAPALDLSYVFVICARRRYRERIVFQPGPYRLGRYGAVINLVAVAWVGFISCVLFLPDRLPLRWETMNYAPFLAALLLGFSTLWWYIGAWEYYKGPRTEWGHGAGEGEPEYERLLDE
ncbi:amino acid permease [Ascobolus immersus RN42]|uniref:Amino acid permease n=1 Tax=Ascobolus immersus RN42 TaxID=1160509 RepID=A0A3N4IMU3_ASCIM|nr:amino acid permease [Ascobolus immersus RN42]